MTFKFHPFKHVSYSDSSRIAKDLHNFVSDEALKRYAQILVDERDKGMSISIQVLFMEESAYIVEVIDSGRDTRMRFSFIVYEGIDRKRAVGLIEVDGLRCITKEEMI
jgi:hypothetical protein